MTRKCPEDGALIGLFMNELRPREAERLLRHLAACARCAVRFNVLRQVKRDLQPQVESFAGAFGTDEGATLLGVAAVRKIRSLDHRATGARSLALMSPFGMLSGLRFAIGFVAVLAVVTAGAFLTLARLQKHSELRPPADQHIIRPGPQERPAHPLDAFPPKERARRAGAAPGQDDEAGRDVEANNLQGRQETVLAQFRLGPQQKRRPPPIRVIDDAMGSQVDDVVSRGQGLLETPFAGIFVHKDGRLEPWVGAGQRPDLSPDVSQRKKEPLQAPRAVVAEDAPEFPTARRLVARPPAVPRGRPASAWVAEDA